MGVKVFIHSVKSIFLFMLGVSLLSYSGYAADNHTWEQDRALLEGDHFRNLSEDEKCKLTWDTLWSWSKKGNLESRATLFLYSYPVGSHASVLLMPGAGDELARRRNAIVLAVHSFGVSFNYDEYQKTYLAQSDMIYRAFLNDPIEGGYFLECMKTKNHEECINYAKGRLVPTFDRYAEEIDLLVKGGMKPECHFAE